MRTIYLIRHGRPDFPGDKPMCLGRTDLPLGTLGRLQGALLGAELSRPGLTDAFCSRLARSRETALLLGLPVTELDGLEELSAGEWDGLSFDEIREKWPGLFELRARDPSIPPPGGESREGGCRRFTAAFRAACAVSQGDIAVVAHASVCQLLLCTALGLPLEGGRALRLPYGSYTPLSLEEGTLTAGEMGIVPHPDLDGDVCMRLLGALDTPLDIAAHSRAVAAEAMRIVCALAAAGVCLDERRIFAAAMLHDIARRGENHAAAGADLIEKLGYADVAGLIRQHHDPEDPDALDEAAVVFIADKLCRGGERVTLRERFASSAEKCGTAEAEKAHERRYAAAVAVAARINEICGKDVIL